MSAIGTKLRHATDGRGGDFVTWWCPGCKSAHQIRVRKPGAPDTGDVKPSWIVTGTPEAPVFSPSVLCYHGGYTDSDGVAYPRETTCHCFVGGSGGQCPGSIEFLGDCPHELAGQTVPLPRWPL